jgi:CHASE2 domain-containing sensor protein
VHPLLYIATGIAAVILALWCYGRFIYGSWVGASFGAKVLNAVASTEAKTRYAFPLEEERKGAIFE